MISEVSSNPRFLGIFYSSLVAERQRVLSREGITILGPVLNANLFEDLPIAHLLPFLISVPQSH